MKKQHLNILPSAAYSIIRIEFESSAGPVSQSIEITIEKECRALTLIWLNQRGGYDSYAFKPMQEEELQAARETAKFAASDFSYHQQKTAAIESSVEGFLRSEYINEETLNWLNSVIESPEAYLADNATGAVKYFPVTVQTTILPHRSRELQQLVVGYRYAETRITQMSL